MSDEVRILICLLYSICDIEENISVLESAAREGEHILLHAVLGLKHPRSVAVDDLHAVAIDDADDTVSRRLRLIGDYAESVAHQLIHQGRLTHIWVADDVDEAALEVLYLIHLCYSCSPGVS